MIWRKSSYSSNGGADCVEAARTPDTKKIATRDSKQPSGPQLSFARAEWQAFLEATKLGKFDLPN